MSPRTLSYQDTLNVKVCGKCGISFAMPGQFDKECEAYGTTFYCPNGHPRVYRTSAAVKLQAELDQMKASRDWEARTARYNADQLEHERRRHAATKGQLTKTRKRAEAGVCPHCPRSFVDVKRHIANKHSEQAVAGLGDGTAELVTS